MLKFFSFLLALGLFLSLAANTLAIADSPTTQTLRQLADSRQFLLGSSGSYYVIQKNPAYADKLQSEFNMMTPENELKWDITEPQPGKFDFYNGDRAVAFAQAHQMRVHGHTLVWFNALPAWLKNGTFSRADLMAILKRHIQTVMGHYKGQVAEWDVVNEALEHHGNGLRDNIFLRTIGPEYIAMAYQWAHEADPNAVLFYNDYGTEIWPQKSDAQVQLLSGLLQQGVPVNAVGLQMHEYTDVPLTVAQYAAELSKLGALGLRVGITEFDASGLQPASKPFDTRLQVQATSYGNALSACLSVSACKSFTTWGVADNFSFQPTFIPLIMDSTLSPKPAYAALQQVLSGL
jgi:endo-1,4-beta-xylanase